MDDKHFHIISVLMENEPGALSRLTGLFSARNFNIESLNVAGTEDPHISRLTLTTVLNDNQCDQLIKQLNRLVDIFKVVDVVTSPHIESELMLIKVDATKASIRQDMVHLVHIFKADILDVSDQVYTIQLVGNRERLDSFINAIEKKNIKETIRSGTLGAFKGGRVLSSNTNKK